jgi:DNA-directed RNA polymerase subunit N (RpoN/RPB10)
MWEMPRASYSEAYKVLSKEFKKLYQSLEKGTLTEEKLLNSLKQVKRKTNNRVILSLVKTIEDYLKVHNFMEKEVQRNLKVLLRHMSQALARI